MQFTPKLAAGYKARWDAMEIHKQAQVDAVVRRILQNKARYQEIEKTTGVPWQFIAVSHYRESNLDFSKNLHNGQPLGMRTTIVPKGRGPFKTFEESCYDALVTLKGLDKVTDWSTERMAYELERYNGFGYQNKKGGNPYLWGGSDQYVKGKYVRDGVYSSTFVDPQLGVMPILKRIEALDVGRKEVVKASRKLNLAKRFRMFLHTFWIGGAGFSITEWFGSFKEYLDILKQFFNDYWVLFAAGGIAVVYILLKKMETQAVEDYKEGRYTPSGLAETKEEEKA